MLHNFKTSSRSHRKGLNEQRVEALAALRALPQRLCQLPQLLIAELLHAALQGIDLVHAGLELLACALRRVVPQQRAQATKEGLHGRGCAPPAAAGAAALPGCAAAAGLAALGLRREGHGAPGRCHCAAMTAAWLALRRYHWCRAGGRARRRHCTSPQESAHLGGEFARFPQRNV